MKAYKTIRYTFRLLIVYIKKYYVFGISGVIIGCIVAYLVAFGIDENFQLRHKTIRLGFIGQHTISDLPDEVLDKLSFGLTKTDKAGELSPGIADKWTVSPDNKQYEFFIISDKFRWTNGTPFSINDINYTFQDVTVEKTDRSILFKLTNTFSPLPSVVAKPLFLSDNIGLGDYKISRFTLKGNAVSEMSLTYIGNQDLPNIVYRQYPTVSDYITGFNLGEIDSLDGLYSTKGLTTGKHIKVEAYIDYQVFTALYFNTEKPDFSQKAFRQALAYSLDKPQDTSRAFSSFYPGSWAYNDEVKPYQKDITRTFELMPKETLMKTNEFTISVFPQDLEMAQQIVNNFTEIGVKSRLETIGVVPDQYDVLLVGRQIPNDPDQYAFWHSTQTGNLAKLRNPRLDKLLEDGRQIADRETRKNIYLDFQRYLLEECPAVFLSHPTMYRVSRI